MRPTNFTYVYVSRSSMWKTLRARTRLAVATYRVLLIIKQYGEAQVQEMHAKAWYDDVGVMHVRGQYVLVDHYQM